MTHLGSFRKLFLALVCGTFLSHAAFSPVQAMATPVLHPPAQAQPAVFTESPQVPAYLVLARLEVNLNPQEEDPMDSLPQEAIEFKNLAEKYEEKGDLEKAEKLYLQSMRLIMKSLGTNHPVSAFALINLADLYIQKKDFMKAEPMYLRSLIIINNAMGPDHFFAALVLNNIGGMYKNMHEFNKAETMYLRSLEIHEKSLGPNHPNVAVPLNNLAELYRMMGDDAKAEPFFLRALDLYNSAQVPAN